MKKTGFTLAEVLITLTIIGVIAAITIPNLMQKWGDHADIQKVKEAYSILSNAVQMTVRENGSLSETEPSASDLQNMIAQYLKVKEQMIDRQNCDYGWNTNGTKQTNPKGDCGYMKGFGGGYSSDNAISSKNALILENGMIFKVSRFASNLSNTYHIFMDINGKKGPNQYGYDIFWFYLYRDSNKLRPASDWGSWASCDTSKSGWTSGIACTDWVIKKGNMDYKYR